MAKIRYYNAIDSLYSSDVVPFRVDRIIAGDENITDTTFGVCSVRGDYLEWTCGSDHLTYTECYANMGGYDPFNGLTYNILGIRGFTMTELLRLHRIQVGETTTLYLNPEHTDYIEIFVDGNTTNWGGHTIRTNFVMDVHIDGDTHSFISHSGQILDAGLCLATDPDGHTGYFPFLITETYSGIYQNRSVILYLESWGDYFYIPAKKLYDGYGQPINQIPIDPSFPPQGGWSNIADLEGDAIDLPDAPDESVTGVLASGFLNIYSPSASQLRAFGGALWTNAFNVKWYDIDSISNLILNAISDPINFIVGLFMLPVTPTTSANSGIKLGGINVNSVSAPTISKQFVTLNFGSLDVAELYANYLDYSYSRLSIYLPYIGMADIDVQEVTGGSVTLQYIIDCFTGACVANVKCTKVTETPWGNSYSNSTVHSYSGNVAVQLPISAGSFDVMTQGLINVGLGLVSGQPQTVSKGATDVIQNVGGDATTRGALSSNTGRLCYQTPYLMFTRPIESRPASLGAVHGYSAGVGGLLKNFSGYVECSDVKLDGISATDTELDMIKTLLHEGVYV